ncbi:MAG: hypothetical protein M1369_03400 [Deinococcus sp.]|nr:hypothetical protein [Deinococcus sp.]MCL5964816.1 hypothetical protein [Deinococcus sp.]
MTRPNYPISAKNHGDAPGKAEIHPDGCAVAPWLSPNLRPLAFSARR